MRGITEERLKEIKENYNQGTSRRLIEYLLDDECTELNEWQPIKTAPPKKKRTFELNGKELPCPCEDYDESVLELLGEHYYFGSIEDRNEVAREIIKLLDNALDKD